MKGRRSKIKTGNQLPSSEKWEAVPIGEDLYADKEFENLISFEVLNDYEIVKEDNASPGTSKKEDKAAKRKSKDETEDKNGKKQKVSKPAVEVEEDVDSVETDDLAVPEMDETEVPVPKKALKKRGKNKINLSKVKSVEVTSDDMTHEASPLSEWVKLGVSDPILKALGDRNFEKPTAIQAMTIPSAILGRKDIVGAAETGSGKTLAFGIPIVEGILKDTDTEQGLKAVILTPTRELAVQIRDHLKDITKYTPIKIVVIVGGLAPQKQERLLKGKPDIVIATPGRMWELVEEGNEQLSSLGSIKFLAVDETDRMVEKGHFQELQRILALANADPEKTERRQNFIFSATLTFTHEPPKRLKQVGAKSKKLKRPLKKINKNDKLKQIMELVGLKDNAKIVDITEKRGTCETLVEKQITCPKNWKEYYLYYFFIRHPGRTIVFCNSINCVRRLTNLFFLLRCNPLTLHSEMLQKQRLRSLERFSSSDNGILIATDIAARGLDITDIQHVIHYEVPRTAEGYIHRSGRTARAFKGGLAVLLIEPAEQTLVMNLMRSLDREETLPSFDVDGQIFKEIKTRVEQAHKVETFEHTIRKKCADMNWFEKARKELDLASSEEDSDDDEDYQRGNTGKKKNLEKAKKELQACKQKLTQLLSVSLFGSAPTMDVRTTLHKLGNIKATV